MSAAEAAVLGAWTVVGADNLWRAWARQEARGQGIIRLILGVTLVAGLAVASRTLERMGSPWPVSPPLEIAGVLCAVTGAGIHLHARRTLGTAWATHVQPATSDAPVTAGLYGIVRHPLYVAVRLLGLGLGLVHPSPATFALGLGLVLGTAFKARAEERALTAVFPALYPSYAAQTPRFCPRPRPA